MDIFLYDNNKNIIGTVNSNNLTSYTQEQELNGLIQADLTGVYSPELEDAVYFGSQDIDDSSIFWRYKITTFDKNNSLFTMSGVYELFDDLQGQNIIKDKRPTNQGVSMALNALLEGTDWEVGKIESNSIATSNWYYINALGAFWDFLEKWKVEYKPRMIFDKGKVVGKFIDIKDRISGDYGKWYEYGDKLVSIVAEKSVNSVYTAFYGRGKGEEKIDENGQKTGGYGRKITFADVEWLESEGDPLDKPLGQEYLEFPNATKRFGYDNQKPRYKIVNFSDIEDKEELLKATYEHGLNEIRPKLQLKAGVIEGELVELGETSTIIRPDIDIKYKTRIFKIKKDFLNRNIKTIELGDKIIQSRTEYMNSITNEIKKVQNDNLSYIERIQKQLTNAMLNSDGYNYNLLPDNIYGLPSGLYSFDAPIDKDPTKVIYFGAGMIAIANSKNPDGSWNFKTFGTGDGFTADLISAGILKGGNSFWNLETGELDIGGIFKVDSSGSGSLDPVLKEELRGEKGEDAIIVSTSEPVDKTKLWRKSTDDTLFYIYVEDEVEDEVEGEWVPIDSKLEDLVVSVQEEVRTHPDKWEGSINTNVQNILDNLTEFQSELSTINDELTGKASIEEVLNQEEIENIINSILKEYPDLIKLNQHFSFDTTNGLQITATDSQGNPSDTSVNIKNDGMVISVEGQESAYFKQKETLTPNLNVEGSAYIGNHTMLGFNGYDSSDVYDENKNFTAFAWSPRFKEV